MNILLINGSPKGNRSNTYRLAKAFIAGLKQESSKAQESISVEELSVNRLQIRPCLGCFSCWNRTPGHCCIGDDMQLVIEKLLWADIVIWSFPLYYFSVPGGLKNLIDRQLPMALPFMTKDSESGGHPMRYDMSGKRNVVISTCGFYTAKGNYDGVLSLFDHMLGKDGYTAIFCGQGELFRVSELSGRTDEYLNTVTKAGAQFYHGGIREETRRELENLLFPREVFEQMADASWGIDLKTGRKEEEALIFTRQMAALYRKEAYPGRNLRLEMDYTDIGQCYQIILGPKGSRVLTEGFEPYTTRIETPFSLWKDIAEGKLRGDEALMKQMYKVKGDFDLMLHWDEYFGGETVDNREKKQESSGQSAIPSKSTNMNCLLIPWILFWVAASIDGFWGSLLSIGGCAAVALLFFRNQKTIYDVLSGALVTLFSLLLLMGIGARTVIPLSYLSFGIMWTVSCLTKIPLTAYYSMNNYDGQKALENPLFLKTNRILTLLWGILYLLTPVWTWAIMGSGLASWTGAINSVLPVLMGIFTAWFQKWYPAKVARGK